MSQQVPLVDFARISTNFSIQSHYQKAPRNSLGILERLVLIWTPWRFRTITRKPNHSEFFVTRSKCRCGKLERSTGSRPGRGRNHPRPKEEFDKFSGLEIMSAMPCSLLKRYLEILLRVMIWVLVWGEKYVQPCLSLPPNSPMSSFLSPWSFDAFVALWKIYWVFQALLILLIHHLFRCFMY